MAATLCSAPGALLPQAALHTRALPAVSRHQTVDQTALLLRNPPARPQLVRNGSYDPKTHAYQAPSSATDKLMAYRSNNTSNNGNSGNGYNNGNSSYP